MASFFTPSLLLKGASWLNRGRVALEGAEAIGKMTRAEKIATGAFAATSGAGEAAQRAKAAREEGVDVSEGQEDFATAQGAIVGLTEMLPISRILGRVPKNIPKGEKDYLINLFKSAGIAAAEEGGQEVSAAILQNMIERGYNPNQEIIEGSLMDDLTIGAGVGALADITLNAFAGRRKGYMSDAQKENERKAREIEARNDFQFRQEMTERKRIGELIKTDPEAFQAEAERVQGLASSIPAPTNEEVMRFNQPSAAGAVATPETLGELYSLRIVGGLGSFFPTNTSFKVEQGEDVPTPAVGPDGTETVVPQPSFKVVDSTGKQYGQTLTNPDVASSLARNLNGEIVGQSIRGSILGTLMTSPQGYNPEQATNLFRYGFQTLNPESNNVTYAALNDAAGTTTENGYIEEVSYKDILNSPKVLVKGGAGKTAYQVTMPNGKKRLAVGLTASQELNRKREAAGLPPVNSFNIRQAREALGGNIGTLGNPSVTGIQDQLQYSPANVGGKPAVVNEANEVLTKRKTTLAEKAKAGFKQDGTSVLPDYIEFQSMDDAKRYADSLNKRNADKRFIPDALFEGKKDLFPQIKALLEAKNIDAEMDSDEIGQLVKSFTGARDAKSMTLEDQKLFYARLRNLPGFSAKTKLPVFRLRPYSPEQFVKATQYQNQNPGAVTDEGLATALGLDPTSPKIAAIKSDLQKQTDARLQKELLKDSRLPLVERLRKALDDYGLSSVTLRLEETLQEANGDKPEGYFERQLSEIALAIDGMDTELNATDEQRLNYLKEVLSHEVVHALRALDLWTAKEWDILTQAAERTIHPETGETFAARARRMYADMSVETQIEESIAELARAYIANKKLIGGKPRNLLERMIRLFQRLKAFVTNSGYQSFEAILNDMRSGAIGARDRGEIRSLRLTKNVPEGYVVADNVPEGVEARTVQDFDEAALEGAEVAQSRKDTGRRYSVKDITNLKDANGNSLKAFAEQFADKIKQPDRTLADVDRIAKGFVEEFVNNPASFLPVVEGSKLSVDSYLRMPDGTMYDPKKMEHANATDQTIQIYNAVNNGTIGSELSQEAKATNKQRAEDLSKLSEYLNGNADYSLAEQALIMKGASKYGVRAEKGREFKLVPIADNNQTSIAVLTATESSAIAEELRNGKSLKQAMLDGITSSMKSMEQSNKDKGLNGWKTFEKSDSEEDAVALKEGCAGRKWCTASATSTARGQLQRGDFHVYYKNGEPIVALRTVDGKLAEPPRGSLENQFMTEEEEKIAEEALRAGRVTGGEDYLHDMDLIADVMAGKHKSWPDLDLFTKTKRKYKIGYGRGQYDLPKPVIDAIEKERDDRHAPGEWFRLGYTTDDVSISSMEGAEFKYIGGNLSIGEFSYQGSYSSQLRDTIRRYAANLLNSNKVVRVDYVEGDVSVSENSKYGRKTEHDISIGFVGRSANIRGGNVKLGKVDGDLYVYRDASVEFEQAKTLSLNATAYAKGDSVEGLISQMGDSRSVIKNAERIIVHESSSAIIDNAKGGVTVHGDGIVKINKARGRIKVIGDNAKAYIASMKKGSTIEAGWDANVFIKKMQVGSYFQTCDTGNPIFFIKDSNVDISLNVSQEYLEKGYSNPSSPTLVAENINAGAMLLLGQQAKAYVKNTDGDIYANDNSQVVVGHSDKHPFGGENIDNRENKENVWPQGLAYQFDVGMSIIEETFPDNGRQFSRKDTINDNLSRFSAVRQSIPATIEVDGVQRPTTNSRGMPIFVGNEKISAEDGIRNFWRWYGDTELVDGEGRPIPVYHSTLANFYAFGDDFRELGWHFGIAPEQGEQIVQNEAWGANISPYYAMWVAGIPKDERSAYWASLNDDERYQLIEDSRPTVPRFKTGANTMPVYLRMQNPVNVGFDAENWEDMDVLSALMSGKGKPFTHQEFQKFETASDVRDALIQKGYDGIFYDNMYEGGFNVRPEAFMVFEGFQIKSALGNVGLYSKDTNQINYSRKDLQGEPKIPFEVAPSPDNKERTAAWRMVPHADKVRITQNLGPKAVREASKILGIDSAAFEPIISGQGLFEGHVNPNQILGIRQQFLSPDEVLEFASVLGRILEQKAMIAADGRMTGRETSVIRIKTNVSSPKVADRIYAALTAELGDLGGYTAYKNHIDVFNFTDTDSETLAGRFVELLKTNTPDINARVSHDTIQSAYLENETYGDYLRRKKSANQERLERGIESARSRIIGELETSISRAGQRSDEQSRVRGLAPGEGRDTDTAGRTGPAKSLEEVKGPDWLPIPKLENAESIPVFAQSKPKKDSVSAFVAHYSNAQGLMSLDGAFAGTGSAGREARRFGLGNYGKKSPPGSLARRLYFYVQSKDALPKKERVVAGNSIYRVRLDNLYDAYNDPRGFSDEAGMNADYFEELVSDAGFDGAVYTEQPGIDEPTVVLFGLKRKVPVRAYNAPEAEQPVAPISEEQAAEAVAKAKKDTELTPKTAVPLYGENASPDALFVAQNPEKGAKLGDKGKKKYSRRGNEPTYSPAAQVLIDQTPQAPNETMGETLVKTMKLGPLRDGVDIFRQAIVFKGARLERQYKENPELARLMADSSALTAYEMMDHSRSMTQAALTNGVPVYVNGGFKVVPFVHKGKTIERGFLEVMAPLNNDKLHGNLERLAHRYAMAVRGERLNAEGKLTPVAPGELAILKAEIQKYRNPETGRPVIEEWYEMWQDYNSYIVKFLRDTGVVDESGAELWLKQADYVPFYREDNQGNLVHPKVFGGLHTASQFKSVGKSSEDLNIDMVTAIVNNIDAAIAMGMKNVAQQRVIRDQINIGLASILKKGETVGDRNSVSFKIAGKRYTAIIEDPLIYQSMLPSSEIGMDNLFGQMLRIPASILRELIIRDPGYMVANMFRDTLSTYVTTGAEVVPLWGTAKGFAGDIQKLRNLGVLGGYDLRLDKFGVRKFYDKEAKRMGMVAGLNWINPISTAWDLMGRISERSEAATRLAVYEDVLKRTGNQVEAQYQALSVMNYGRRGNNALFRALTAVVPFLNARVQGLDKLWQAGTGRVGAQYKTDAAGNVIPEAQRRKNFARFVYRAGLITAVSAMYYAMVSDDDEYLNASPEIRDNYYILPIMKGDIESGKPGLSARLPIPFEVGILFKVVPERLIASIYGEDTPKDFVDSMLRAGVSTLGINPTPQAVLPIAEMLVNKDFYSGRPIVPTYMENLLPEQQKTFYTNQLAESVANSIGASPMKIQHLMQGYGGTLGGYFLQAIDSMARENEMVLPSTEWYQKPFIKRFFTTANQPGLQNKFYELKDDVDGITQTINRLQKDGRYDELAAFYAKNGHMYEMRTDLNYLEKQITMLREQRKVIEQMDIDPESKREAIEQINMMISATLISVPMYREMAYDKQ